MIDFRRVQLYFSNIIAEIINSDDDIVNISFLIKKLYLISELQILKIVDLFSFVVEESSFKETLLLASSNEFKI